ncbi:hypothetical protein IEE_05514 [Bacillus cereus BAG5X1-1]|uniref:Uncharacterized protein n=1 Tax=Bacillus cereus BAG5X1-1 TaxID=1053189 RepID=J8ABK2_BACCE|nr:hypothetical protein [Bacillus cereus]EJQ35994.1 hypothetical protein IEE_05514 [Bacillus cereus BAG5X1-1]
MSKNYSIDRDKNGRFRHSFVFMRGSEVSIKVFGVDSWIKGIVSSIEKYYLVIDVAEGEEKYQVTVNLSEIKYIKHEELPTVEERSANDIDKSTSFVFSVGDKVGCMFKDGKGIGIKVPVTVLSEGAFYLYVETDKGTYLTVMKSAVSYVRHEKYEPGLLVNDFYTAEMRDQGYSKPTEFTFSVGDSITVVFESGKELSGVVLDEEKYWILLMIDEKKGTQVTVLKQSYVYIRHAQFDTKANLYVENKQLKKRLRKADQ